MIEYKRKIFFVHVKMISDLDKHVVAIQYPKMKIMNQTLNIFLFI